MSPAATSNCKWKLPYIRDHVLDSLLLPVPFIGVTETWFKPYISDAQVKLDGYNCFRADREKRIGGGCALYVYEGLLVSKEFSYSDHSNNLVSCFINSMNTFIAVLYRPPKSQNKDFNSTLEILQRQIDEANQSDKQPDIYILGDFNLPSIDWEYCTVKSGVVCENPEATKLLLDFMDRNFFTQVVTKPTRGNNTLDLIFTNKPQDVLNVNCNETKLTEHRLVEALLGHNPITKVESTFYTPYHRPTLFQICRCPSS